MRSDVIKYVLMISMGHFPLASQKHITRTKYDPANVACTHFSSFDRVRGNPLGLICISCEIDGCEPLVHTVLCLHRRSKRTNHPTIPYFTDKRKGSQMSPESH
jgi:hypothetical protein